MISNFHRKILAISFVIIVGAFVFKALNSSFLLSQKNVSFLIKNSSDCGRPFTTIEIEGKSLPVLIDLGSKHHILLLKEDLANLKKKENGKTPTTDVFGRTVSLESYELPEVTLGKYKITNCEVSEAKPRCLITSAPPNAPAYGYLGRKFLLKENLALNLSREKMEHCKHPKQKTPPIARFPIEITPFGVLANLETTLGTKKFALDTGATHSCLRKSDVPFNLQESNDSGIFYYKSYLTQGKAFFSPEETFILIDFTEKLSSIDGILGVSFLKKYALFFDFIKKELLVYPPDDISS